MREQKKDFKILSTQEFKFENFLISGNFESLNQDTIFIGEPLASRLDLKLDDSVILYSQSSIEKISNEEFLFPVEFKVAGIFRTGSPNLDENLLIGSLGGLQGLLGKDNVISGFYIDYESSEQNLATSLDSCKDYLTEVLDASSNGVRSDLLIQTWKDKNADFYSLLSRKRELSLLL